MNFRINSDAGSFTEFPEFEESFKEELCNERIVKDKTVTMVLNLITEELGSDCREFAVSFTYVVFMCN